MSSALQTCDDRIVAALEYLAHEAEPLRAISLAEHQLRQALISLRVGRGLAPMLRASDALETAESEARSFTEVRGRLVVAEVEALLEQLP